MQLSQLRRTRIVVLLAYVIRGLSSWCLLPSTVRMASSSLSSRGRPSWIVIGLLIASIALGYLYYSVSLSKTKLQAELLSLREAKSLSDHTLAHIRERVELSRKEYRATTEKYERERVDAQRSRQASEAELKSKLSQAIGEVEEKSSRIAQLSDTLERHVDLIADLRIRNTTLSRRHVRQTEGGPSLSQIVETRFS